MVKSAALFLVGASGTTSWTKKQYFKCDKDHGATPIDTDPIENQSLEDCQAACDKESSCEGIAMDSMTCSESEKVNCWRYKNIDLSKCYESGLSSFWLKNQAVTTPVQAKAPLAVMPSLSSRPPATCTPCPALQTFDDPNVHQNCKDQKPFQWIKDLIAKGCNQEWNLEAGVYEIDRQYLLPCGVTVKGAGIGKTIIKAVRCGDNFPDEVPEDVHDYGLGTEGAKYRIGLLVNTNTEISHLSFQGVDTYRYGRYWDPVGAPKGKDYTPEGYGDGDGALCYQGGNGVADLQGGAPFETPGCADPYACGITPCINGKFTTPVGYKWDPVSSIAVQNVLVHNVEVNNTQTGFFGAPLFPEHLGKDGDFDVNVHRPSNIKIINYTSDFTHGDGINLHGNFDDVLIDNFVVREARDDCIALWSYKDTLGKVTIQNSDAQQCGYQGCYVVYGGTGPFKYTDNKCSSSTEFGAAKCLWLDGSMFNGQFNAKTDLTSTGAVCSGPSAEQKCVPHCTAGSINCEEESMLTV